MLTDTAIRNAKPKDQPYKLADEKGMYLLVNRAGKYWRMNYRFAGKQKTMAFGVYPDVSLVAARKKRDAAREWLAKDCDPSEHRRVEKLSKKVGAENSFKAVALEWYDRHVTKWAPSHSDKIKRRLERDIYPRIGKRPIAEVKAAEILAALRRIEERGAVETAHRALQNCSQVFRYAVATGRADRDPCGDLRGSLSAVNESHHAAITEPKAIGGLLRAIDGYSGYPVTAAALKLAPLVFVRPGELRHAEWSEIDLDAGEWRIPAEKMKMRALHIVPLSRQAVEVLKELEPLTGHGKYVFPGLRAGGRAMSENTVNAALRRLGYAKNEMTGHGFRSMASTILNEQGWNRDAIERQLAHAERDEVRAAYNYAEHLPERRKMMQAWADYLDTLKAGAKVLRMRGKVA